MSSTGLTYRTPADVRAIPQEQWERWIVTATTPTDRFVGADTRRVAFEVMWATRRRLERG